MDAPEVRLVEVRSEDLTLGFAGERIWFEHRPYKDRNQAKKEAYERLRADLLEHGMLNPLITFQNHVLVGMRRYEIMSEQGLEVFPCLEIQEDVSKWWQDGPPKLDAIMREHYQERPNA